MDYEKRVNELLKMPQELCNMCGLCCKLASFKGGMSVKEIKEIANDFSEPTQADGAKDFLTIFEPIDVEEAKQLSPAFVEDVLNRFKEKQEQASFFKCRFLGDNKCLIHEDRPILCRMYPIPHERTVYHDSCGFKDQGVKNWNEIKQIIIELQEKSRQLEEERQQVERETQEHLAEAQKLLDQTKEEFPDTP
ncbi:MAG: YkgJ family cysteine cluster protein [Vampirovibrionia bacterium]